MVDRSLYRTITLTSANMKRGDKAWLQGRAEVTVRMVHLAFVPPELTKRILVRAVHVEGKEVFFAEDVHDPAIGGEFLSPGQQAHLYQCPRVHAGERVGFLVELVQCPRDQIREIVQAAVLCRER